MMRARVNAIVAAILSVALVVALFPVPVGAGARDIRYRQANANPAVAAGAVFATALAVYGVYVAGSSISSYNVNRSKVYNDFISANGLTQLEADNMMASGVTSDGNIDLGKLADAGFFGLVPALISNAFNAGTAVEASNSYVAGDRKVMVSGTQFAANKVPEAVMYAFLHHYTSGADDRLYDQRMSLMTYPKQLMGYAVYYGSVKDRYELYFCNEADKEAYYYYNSGKPYLSFNGYSICYVYAPHDGSAIYSAENVYSYNKTVGWYSTAPDRDKLNPDFVFHVVNDVDGPQLVTVDAPQYITVEPAAVSGQVTVSREVVKVIEPTQEQLESGYDKTAVLKAEIAQQQTTIEKLQKTVKAQAASIDALNANVGTLESSLTASQQKVGAMEASLSSVQENVSALDGRVGALESGLDTMNDGVVDILETIMPWSSTLASILAALNPLGAILTGVNAIVTGVQGIFGVVSGVESSPFAWLNAWWVTLSGWWSDLLAWMGVNDASSWWGTLSGWWQGLLDWVGETPIGALVDAGVGVLDGAIAGVGVQVGSVADAVNTGVAEIVDAVSSVLDGVLAGEVSIKPPTMGNGHGIGLADSARVELERTLDEKAPFCYVRRVQAVGAGLESRFTSAETFYVDVPIPYMDSLRFDAGILLNQTWGGNTLAYYMRVLLTSVICAGLLSLAIKIAMSVLGVGGGE